MKTEASPDPEADGHEAAPIPGRSLRTDPRAHPAMVAALAPFGLDQPAPTPPVTSGSSRADLLDWAQDIEVGFEALFDALTTGLPPVVGVTSETVVGQGPDGHELTLYVSRPTSAKGALPCAYHLHGGGMVIAGAVTSTYQRWREEVAATGLVVVGVEFRNGAGKLGPHPYPAGLDDCASGVRWVSDHLSDLGATHIVVTGDSGGANLSLALALKARREGFLSTIAGVYAQCPYVYGKWMEHSPELPSLAEHDGYFINRAMLANLAELYDPGAANVDDPTCWPSRATAADMEGLPPHVISLNELDPLRDEGLAYYRTLLAAGVPTIGQMNLGLCHVGELLLPGGLPEVYAANIWSLNRFAQSLLRST